MEWFLLAVIIIALIILGVRLKKVTGGGGSTPASAGDQALQKINDKLTELREANRKPTADECTKLKEWYEAARSGGIPSLTLDPVKSAIDAACPAGQ